MTGEMTGALTLTGHQKTYLFDHQSKETRRNFTLAL